MGAHTLRSRSQTETDYFWEKLAADGGEQIQCGWLKDKIGMPWQIGMDKVWDWLRGRRSRAR